MPPSEISSPPRAKVFLLHGCIWFLYLFIAAEGVDLLYSFGLAIFTHDPTNRGLLISTAELRNLTPVFLSILIALELIETLEIYLRSQAVRIQMILLVGLTAITRHLLATDLAHGEAALNLSIAAMILALAGAYFLIERSTAGRPNV